MKLEIIDKQTRSKVEMIRTYDYVQYKDEFVGEGKFQINLPVSDVALPYLVRGNFIIFEEGIVGIIKGIKDAQDEERQIVVTGKLTNHVLAFRSILKTERYSAKITTIARKLLENHFITPTDERRRIEFVTLATDEQYIPDAPSIYYCDTGKTVRESIATTFLPYGYGFEMYPILDDYNEEQGVLHNLSALEFRVLRPVDRTIGNADGNTPVVFSFQLSNLSRLEYEEDGSSYCSVAIVASEGTGDDRKTLEVGETGVIGFDRIELYIDARDIRSVDEEGNTIAEEELFALMQQRGLEKLEGHKVFTSFDGNVLVSGDNRYEYGVDFYKGDYVSIIDDNYGRIYNLQITSVTKSISEGVEYFDLGFGLDKVSTKSLINTSTSSSGGGGSSSSSGGSGEKTTVTVKVNETTTGEPGTAALVTNIGDDVNLVLNFTIPRGAPGENGAPGKDGADGAPGKDGVNGKDGADGLAATIEIGSVTTVAAGQQAKVTNTGTAQAAKFNFEIPQGPQGEGAAEALAALGGFTFGYTDDGKPGYKEAGADTVIPFSDGSRGEELEWTLTQIIGTSSGGTSSYVLEFTIPADAKGVFIDRYYTASTTGSSGTLGTRIEMLKSDGTAVTLVDSLHSYGRQTYTAASTNARKTSTNVTFYSKKNLEDMGLYGEEFTLRLTFTTTYARGAYVYILK